jgi:hypothetical protein
MSALLFFHALTAFVLVGGIGAVAVSSRFSALVAWRTSAFLVVPSAVATIALGEGLASMDGTKAGWLDAGRGLALAGLLLGGIVLAILARRALQRPSLARPVWLLAAALIVIALAVEFLMAAKPT